MLLSQAPSVAFAADAASYTPQGGIEEVKEIDFANLEDVSGFLAAENDARFAEKPADVNGSMTFKLNGTSLLPDCDSPVFADGEIEVTYTPGAKSQKLGVLFRYQDDQNWAAFVCDGVKAHSGDAVADTGKWKVVYMVDGEQTSVTVATDSLARVRAGTEIHLWVKFVGDELLVRVDDEIVLDTYIAGLPTGEGKAGIYVEGSDELTADRFGIRTYQDVEFTGGNEALSAYSVAGDMTVTIDKSFPRIASYTLGGKSMTAQAEEAGVVRINGADYTPSDVAFTEDYQEGERFSATYELTFSQLGDTKLTYQISSEGNGVIDFSLTDVQEGTDFTVYTIKLVDNTLATISADGDQYDGMYMAYDTHEWVNAGEESLVVGETLDSYKRRAVYPFLTTADLSVGAQNNNYADVYKFGYRVDTQETGELSSLSLENGTYVYRYEPQFYEEGELSEEIEERYMIQDLFSCQITVARDYNEDGALSWQDGAAFFATQMNRPAEWEETRDYQMYIAMNFLGSVNPFLRQLDDAKKIYNLTDGFGQRILEKGYQAQGHDDSHPDYGDHVGERAGGLDDLNTLVNEGEKYNVQVGVHINTVSFQVDAYNWIDENIKHPYLYNYKWVDNEAEPIFEKDILSGELGRRLDVLAENVPGLDFIYHDVYHGLDYHGKILADQMEKNSWAYGGEYGSGQWMMFSHGATDRGNGGRNDSSTPSIERFLRNSYVDNFNVDPILRGARMLEYGEWQGYGNITDVPRTFFTSNLPTKYLQYSDLVSWNSDEAKFSNGARSVKEGDRTVIYGKDGTKIADLSYAKGEGVDTNGDSTAKIFVPWNPNTEEKICHYMGSMTDGASTWTLPESWSDVVSVNLYKLSDLGREFVASIPVEDHAISLTVDTDTGYVLEKGGVDSTYEPAADWGHGSHLVDPGFDSHAFVGESEDAGWTLTTENPEVATIVNDTETRNSAKGDTLFKVTGGNGEGATISQTMNDLEEGQTYEASIWLRLGASGTLDKQRKVTLEVNDGEGGTYSVSNYVDCTPTSFGNFTSNHSKYKSAQGYNKLTVFFTVPEGKADSMQFIIHVEDGAPGDSVTIDDARVWEYLSEPADVNAVFYEDFENAPDLNGKFIGNINYNHLAERSEKNADRSMVINGNYSLKIKSGAVRTMPQTLRLEPNTDYRLEFKYIFWNEQSETSPTTSFNATVKGDDKSTIASVQCFATVPDADKSYPYNTPDYATATLEFNTGDNQYAYLEFPSSSYKLILDDVKVSKVLPDAETPTITEQPVGADVKLGEEVILKVDATATDGGTFTYQWYSNTADSNANGTPITGATEAEYRVPTNAVGTVYYYVVVTNTNDAAAGNKTASIASDTAAVAVSYTPSTGGGDTTDPTEPTEPTEPEWENPYSDVSDGYWAYDAIRFVTEEELFQGVSGGGFAPELTMSRAMLATVLYRAAGSPAVTASAGFTDVPDGQWYSDAVNWAASEGIVNGVGGNRFAPDDNVSREQIATILYQYVLSTGETAEADASVLSGYGDSASVHSWAADGMAWAVGEGIITGKPGSLLAPTDSATRAEVATMLMRFLSA